MRTWWWLTLASGNEEWAGRLNTGDVFGYPSLSQAHALLDEWVQQYPTHIRRETVGESYEKRPMYSYVLKPPAAGTAEVPQILITAMTHAREPAGMTVSLFFVGRTLERYSRGDPTAMYLLDNREIWVLPFVNPDGWVAIERTKNRWIRKNRRPTCPGRQAQSSGVDLNRNFDYKWELGRSTDPCREEYGGTAPFSEPETQCIKSLVETHNFVMAMNFHTYGSMLTYPFNWMSPRDGQPPAELKEFFDEVQSVVHYDQGAGTVFQVLGYTTSGEADDWMYGKHHIFSMTPEVGPEASGFIPKAHEIAGIDTRNFVRTTHIVLKGGFLLQPCYWAQPSAMPPGLEAEVQRRPGWAAVKGFGVVRHAVVTLRNGGASASRGHVFLAVDNVVGVSDLGVVAVDDVGQTLEAKTFAPSRGLAILVKIPPTPRRSHFGVNLAIIPAVNTTMSRSPSMCVLEDLGDRGTCQCVSWAADAATVGGDVRESRPPTVQPASGLCALLLEASVTGTWASLGGASEKFAVTTTPPSTTTSTATTTTTMVASTTVATTTRPAARTTVVATGEASAAQVASGQAASASQAAKLPPPAYPQLVPTRKRYTVATGGWLVVMSGMYAMGIVGCLCVFAVKWFRGSRDGAAEVELVVGPPSTVVGRSAE